MSEDAPKDEQIMTDEEKAVMVTLLRNKHTNKIAHMTDADLINEWLLFIGSELYDEGDTTFLRWLGFDEP